MLSRLRSLGHEQTKGQLHFRILPISIKHTNQLKDNSLGSWLLYLEKGMQILGKTVQFQMPLVDDEYLFNPTEHKFDFQIASQKNFNYTWSLYSIDELGEERIGAEIFSIKDYYLRQQKQNNRSGYDLQVKLKNFTLKFKLFIQNNMSNIIQLLTPESQDEIGKTFSTIKKPQINGILRERNKQKQTISQILPQKQKQIDQTDKIKAKSTIQNNPKIEPKTEKNKPSLQSKIEEQEQEQSHNSTIKSSNESKLALNVEAINLQRIDEDKQKQDIYTPMYSKIKKPGFSGISFQDSQKQYIKQDHQQNHVQQQNKGPTIAEQKQQVSKEQQIKYQTPGESQSQIQPEVMSEGLKDSKLLKKQITTGEETSNSKNFIKKLIVLMLFIILFGGIFGSLVNKSKKTTTKKIEVQQKTKLKKTKAKK